MLRFHSIWKKEYICVFTSYYITGKRINIPFAHWILCGVWWPFNDRSIASDWLHGFFDFTLGIACNLSLLSMTLHLNHFALHIKIRVFGGCCCWRCFLILHSHRFRVLVHLCISAFLHACVIVVVFSHPWIRFVVVSDNWWKCYCYIPIIYTYGI